MKYDFEDHCWKELVSEELLEIYKPYRRETYVGKKPAVLVVDLYNLAYEGGPKPVIELQKEFPSSCGVHAWDAIEPTKKLLEAARANGFPVIYLTGDQRTREKGAFSSTNRKSASVKSENAYEIYPDFKPEPENLIIYKTRASGFYGTPLSAYLTMMGVDSLIVCGESTSGCVRASVVDAYSHGFHSVVVEECCFDRSPLSHKVSLFDLHHKYADVMHIDEVLEHLANRKLQKTV
jgi:maleamate amidohydrolase